MKLSKSIHVLSFLLFTLYCASAKASFLYLEQQRACCVPVPKWYVGVGGGLVMLDDAKYTHPGFTVASVDTQTFDPGYNINGMIGYRIYPRLRAELEVSGRITTVSEDPGAAVIGPGQGDAETKSIAVMANGYFDFTNKTRITPYVGGGLGIARVESSRLYTNNLTSISSDTLEGTVPAYQFMAGVSYKMGSAMNPIEIFLGYRYFVTDDIEGSPKNGPPGKISFPYEAQSAEGGVRFLF